MCSVGQAFGALFVLVFCISQFLLISTLLCWWNTTKEWKKNCQRHLTALPVSESELRRVCGSLRSKRFRLVSEQRKPRNGILGFGHARNEARAEKWKWGRGRVRKETLSDKPLDFENLRLIGSVSRTMLTCVDQRFVSYWEDGMVRDTYINFQWLLFILVGKICPPMQEHFLWLDLFWNVRLS